MAEVSTQVLIDGLVAAGLGLFVGLEREHRDIEDPPEPEKAPADAPGVGEQRPDYLGVRTFALVAVLGWLSSLLEADARGLTIVSVAVLGALLGLQYVRTWTRGAGITTEVAAIVTFALGYLTSRDRLLSVAVGVGVTLVLFSKPWVRRLVPMIRRAELTATIQLALMMAIVLPLLPAEPIDPWGALAPRKVGYLVVMIAGLSFVGYVMLRAFGRQRGAGIAGLVGGLASSTAVTAAMAQQARAADSMVGPAQLATFLANTVMFARVVLVAFVLNKKVALGLAIPMASMGAVMLGGAIWKWRTLSRARKNNGDDDPGHLDLANPFALLPALKWGALLSAILLITAIARQELGTRGLLATAAISGLADVDAMTIAATRETMRDGTTVHTAVLAITIATIANTITKGGIALFSGGRRFGRDIALVFGAAIVVGAAVAILG